jgi:hypothetical protein
MFTAKVVQVEAGTALVQCEASRAENALIVS